MKENPTKEEIKKSIIDIITENEKETRDNLWITKVQLSMIPVSLRPNVVTVVRFFLIVLSVFLYFRNPVVDYVQWVIIIVAAWTDLIDGSMARTRNQITALGTFLDPLADNLLTVWIFLVLMWQGVLPVYLGWGIIMIKFVVMFAALISILITAFQKQKQNPGAKITDTLRQSVFSEISVSFIGRLQFAALVFAVIFLMLSVTVEKMFIADLFWSVSLPMIGSGFALYFLTERPHFNSLGKTLVAGGIALLTISQLSPYAHIVGIVIMWAGVGLLVLEIVGYKINKKFSF